MKWVSLFFLMTWGACATPKLPDTPVDTPETARSPATVSSRPKESAQSAPTQPSTHTLWEGSRDLDGDGSPEAISLTSSVAKPEAKGSDDDPRLNVHFSGCYEQDPGAPCFGVLKVGALSQKITLQGGYFGGIGISFIDIDTRDGREEILLTQRGGDDEDPPYHFRVLVYDGHELRLHTLFASYGYNSGQVTVDGKGALTVLYDECPDAFTVVYQLRGLDLIAGPTQTKRVRDPETCAACPHVFVMQAQGEVHKGEILMDQREVGQKGWQSLTLVHPERFPQEEGSLQVIIRELKVETTFLDAVYLEVDGLRVLPDRCAAFSDAVCEEDGVAEVLRFGDALTLSFSVPALDARSTVRLWANGFYEYDAH